MTPPLRQINQPRRRCCPMCDHGGFRRVMDHYLHKVLFQCTNCGHEWTRSQGAATDRRKIIQFQKDSET